MPEQLPALSAPVSGFSPLQNVKSDLRELNSGTEFAVYRARFISPGGHILALGICTAAEKSRAGEERKRNEDVLAWHRCPSWIDAAPQDGLGGRSAPR